MFQLFNKSPWILSSALFLSACDLSGLQPDSPDYSSPPKPPEQCGECDHQPNPPPEPPDDNGNTPPDIDLPGDGHTDTGGHEIVPIYDITECSGDDCLVDCYQDSELLELGLGSLVFRSHADASTYLFLPDVWRAKTVKGFYGIWHDPSAEEAAAYQQFFYSFEIDRTTARDPKDVLRELKQTDPEARLLQLPYSGFTHEDFELVNIAATESWENHFLGGSGDHGNWKLSTNLLSQYDYERAGDLLMAKTGLMIEAGYEFECMHYGERTIETTALSANNISMQLPEQAFWQYDAGGLWGDVASIENIWWTLTYWYNETPDAFFTQNGDELRRLLQPAYDYTGPYIAGGTELWEVQAAGENVAEFIQSARTHVTENGFSTSLEDIDNMIRWAGEISQHEPLIYHMEYTH